MINWKSSSSALEQAKMRPPKSSGLQVECTSAFAHDMTDKLTEACLRALRQMWFFTPRERGKQRHTGWSWQYLLGRCGGG